MRENSRVRSASERFVLFASRVAIVVCVIVAFSIRIPAQSTSGTVLGTVTDPSGRSGPAGQSGAAQYRNQRGPGNDHQREWLIPVQ